MFTAERAFGREPPSEDHKRIINAIAAAIREKGYDCEVLFHHRMEEPDMMEDTDEKGVKVPWYYASIMVEHEEVGQYIEFKQCYKKVGWHNYADIPGKLDVTVGRNEYRQRFPAKKDKSHSYDKMVMHLVNTAHAISDKNARDAQEIDNRAHAKKLGKIRSVMPGLRVHIDTTNKKAEPVHLSIVLSEDMPIDRAEAMLTKLASIGWIEREKP